MRMGVAKWAAAAALALCISAPAAAQMSNAVNTSEWGVKGLAAPAEIIVDQWGVPHIYAQSKRDAFFLQGYNAARDRLWQIDLWRKRGLGRLSASFGPAYVEQDRAARLFLYRGDMAAEWAAYAPDARDVVEAWAAGVNAYVAEVRAGTRPLPVEFRLTGTAPEDWKADDVLRVRSHALVSNVSQEVARARTVCAGGVEADMLRRKLEPAHKLAVPRGLNACDVPADVLADYFLATRGVDFEALVRKDQAALSPDQQLADAIDGGMGQGSNNWVIAPGKSETGRPILANDPHRQLQVPALRYVVGLHAPGLDIIGAGEPALPGISLGHNGHIAFGITIFAIDQEDLYVYELNRTDADRYRYRGGWERMTVVRETIEVKGEAPREVELRFTRHGPVLNVDAGKRRAFAMRTVWNEPGVSGYFGSSRLWGARTWDDFKAASAAWGAPPLNLVYADVQGNVGWAASGRTPVRRNWDGLMPVPGDGRYEWAGFQPKDVLPSVLNPAEGFFATANEMNLPDGFPVKNRPALEWVDPSRATRIKEVLRADGKVGLNDSMALQVDAVNPQARRAVALLAGVSSGDAEVTRALDMLRAWDGHESVDSVAAAIYHAWVSGPLGRAVVNRVTPEAAREIVGNGHLEAVISYLEAPGPALSAPGAREAVLAASLGEAVANLQDRLGGDMGEWTWGRLHHALFVPAIGVLADEQLLAQMSVGPLQVPGSNATPRAQSYRASDFRVMSGASVRFVMDVGAWDNSVMMNSPGQSADPYSAHYRDLFPLWAEGSFVPMRFTRAGVEDVAKTVFRLTPGG